jgi:putative acetyltransferase
MPIREEDARDAAAIRALIDAAFRTAPHRSGTEAAIVDTLRLAGALALSLVAEEGGTLLGQAAFSPVTVAGRDLGWIGLGPVSVLPERQGQGIGGALIGDGLDRLRRRGAAGCVVLGEPAYYRRFGFRADPALRYPAAPARYFLALPFGGPPPGGEVAYHAAFGAA